MSKLKYFLFLVKALIVSLVTWILFAFMGIFTIGIFINLDRYVAELIVGSYILSVFACFLHQIDESKDV